jgi:hypothetical protein
VKLNALLVAERRCDALHHQLLLRDGLAASAANLAGGGITPESCHPGKMPKVDSKDLVKIDHTCECFIAAKLAAVARDAAGGMRALKKVGLDG